MEPTPASGHRDSGPVRHQTTSTLTRELRHSTEFTSTISHKIDDREQERQRINTSVCDNLFHTARLLTRKAQARGDAELERFAEELLYARYCLLFASAGRTDCLRFGPWLQAHSREQKQRRTEEAQRLALPTPQVAETSVDRKRQHPIEDPHPRNLNAKRSADFDHDDF